MKSEWRLYPKTPRGILSIHAIAGHLDDRKKGDFTKATKINE